MHCDLPHLPKTPSTGSIRAEHSIARQERIDGNLGRDRHSGKNLRHVDSPDRPSGSQAYGIEERK